MDIAAIVVNFRTPAATVEAVTGVLREIEGFEEPRVAVVDNDSQDGSLEELRRTFANPVWGDRVSVIDAGHNGGYGFGINVGVRSLLGSLRPPRHIYIINPDAAPELGSVKRLVAFMDSRPDVGLAGSLIHSPSGDHHVKAFRFPSVWSEIEGAAGMAILSRLLGRHVTAIYPPSTCEVDWVSGTSMLVRREVFEQVGLFDEGFFLYFEEIDFARRVHAAGFKVCYVANAGIVHVGSLATGMTDETRPMPKYWFQARRRYFVKHHGPLYGAACDVAWICGRTLFVAKARLLGRALVGRPHLFRDFVRYSVGSIGKPAPVAEQNTGPRAGTHPPAT